MADTKIAHALETKLIEMENQRSPFECALRQMPIPVASVFKKGDAVFPVSFVRTKQQVLSADSGQLKQVFSKTVGASDNYVLAADKPIARCSGKRVAVLFSGGPAAGGHNVLAGIKQVLGEENKLYGVRSGPKGLLAGDLFEITDDAIVQTLNLGGFDLLGSDRTKIKTPDHYAKVKKVVKDYKLDGIVIIGGDDSNTNAAFLAEYLYDEGCTVVGVPKTIDGDLQIDKLLPISFGFDTATRIYAELVGNILKDTPSSRKYWHFVKLMGRAASHVALEVALHTRPHIALISEEIFEKNMTLNDVVEYIAGIIAYRAAKGINYGVVVIPEGIIEFIPEFKRLIAELDDEVSELKEEMKGLSFMQQLALVSLSRQSAQLFGSLPDAIVKKLLMDRDSHGNLQVSQIPTEVLLIELVEKKIIDMKAHPHRYFGSGRIDLDEDEISVFFKFKFQTNYHFFGYEGRCGAPSLFDAAYTYNLGLVAGSLVLQGHTGFMASLTDLHSGGKPLAIPLTGLIHIERREGKEAMVIEKALIDLKAPAFQFFLERRKQWAASDLFVSPGPRQLWGPQSMCMPISVALNQGYQDLNFKIG